MIPGATIPGEAYRPLLAAVQAAFPGQVWGCATAGWTNNFPNPLEIKGQVEQCLAGAAELGLPTETVFYAGHSLGGVVLETFLRPNADLAAGMALLGTWLPDLLGRQVVESTMQYE